MTSGPPCVFLSLAKSENQTTCTPARWSVVRFEATAAASLEYRASFSLQLVLHWQPAGESVERHRLARTHFRDAGC